MIERRLAAGEELAEDRQHAYPYHEYQYRPLTWSHGQLTARGAAACRPLPPCQRREPPFLCQSSPAACR
eukprot:3377280-Prymnesium_polylepis.1